MPGKLSPVEIFKQDSEYLGGEIADELVDENDFFGKSSIQLLKHHGTYQQDDRDNRGAGGKSYIFMEAASGSFQFPMNRLHSF